MRRLLWICVWLFAALAGGARATDFNGVGRAVFHFNPPAGYCQLSQSSPDYKRLSTAFAGPKLATQVKVILLRCADIARPPALPETSGYLYIVQFNQNNAPSDDARSDWLQTLSPDKTPGVASGVDSVGNASHFDWTAGKHTVDGKDYAEVTAQGATVLRDTPVDIAVVREVDASDPVAVATALDSARKDMHAAFDRFARDNHLSLDRAATARQVHDAWALGGLEFIFISGGIVLVTIVVRRFWAQASLSGLLAIAGVLVYESAPGAGYATSTTWGDLLLWSALSVVLVGIANGVLKLGGLVRLGRLTLTERIRRALSTRAWLGTPLREGDFTKRWFVTVAAATGCVVFAMLVRPHFTGELLSAFGPTRIIFTLLITVVSVTLIGPVETYIFESRIAARGPAGHEPGEAHLEEESRFEHMLELMSPRALGRFALVLVFMLMLTVAHGALEASVHEGDSMDTFTMLISGVGPGIVTYYWCCALQRGVSSVAHRAGVAAAIAGALLIGAPVALIAAPLFMTHLSSSPGSLLADVLAAPLAILGGALVFGGLAFAGGLTIDQARARRLGGNVGVLLLGAVVMAVTAGFLGLFYAAGALFMHAGIGPLEWTVLGVMLLAISGWTLGLLVSGFPGVLKASLDHTPLESPPAPLWIARVVQGLLRPRRPAAPTPAEAAVPASKPE